MDDRFNTIAGWALAGGIAALSLSIVSGMVFHSERPEKMGYAIEGVEETGGEGAAAVLPIATRLASADVAKGADVFKQCTACHTINQGGASGIGPNLYASVGKAHGHVPGFAYSDALKAVPGTWTFDALDSWLASPRKYAPGTKMTFAGIANPQDRANVIAYLNSQGSNLPLPTAPAAEPAADAEAQANVAEGADPAEISNQATPGQGTPAQSKQNAIQAEEKGVTPNATH
ncbi:c-type cytochrome [Sphingomonas sp. M1-B02]|uniref:c-type cytochrome n=1 Tax=Sphingomonas sp. M1-B02 TaxID=3114300 RepID=UPI0022404373|nr:cytochrome c family protein [Sphingomonas sp. S6-11]UZK65570.1 cytochrome c family protein [Sphingomonas sp. S6-11]